ncbi:MAG: DHH family phosphoesterase [Oscillospiraceae bacterium]|nr:DHH family phosphoesterase [Oscillospiraceae bacterium]
MDKKIFRFFEPSVALCFVVMLLFAAVTFFFDMIYLAAIEAGVAIVLFVVYLIFTQTKKRQLRDYILSTTSSRDNALGSGVPFPMAVLRVDTGEVVWTNAQFQQITGLTDSIFDAKIEDVIPDFDARWLIDGKPEYPIEVTLGKRRYYMSGNLFRPAGADSGRLMASLYLTDQTELLSVRDEYIRSRPIVAIVLIDNYDELTNNLAAGSVSSLDALIGARIAAWTKDINCLNRKFERNRYLLVMEQKDLAALEAGKFSLLDSVHEVVNPSGIAASVSIGIGKDGADFEESFNFAVLSIEMALSRGGDQAVIKDRYNFSFFGGRAKEAERHSKVKSRVLAGSLTELIRQSNQVYVMGHKNADLDAIGAAVGLGCLCRKCGKQVKIVVDEANNVAASLIRRMKETDAYAEAFISAEEAMLLSDPRSLLIVVDTNRPEQVESRALLETIPRVVLIDHHRMAADSIDQVVLTLHEPSVSSASELVTELLQYAADPQDLMPEEARALLAGIVLDTKNFAVRTGSGTFEAAAFLRRLGADPTEVKKLFQSDLATTISRYRIIQHAKQYAHGIAISALDYTTSRATAGQAADELLNIEGITASFVLYPDGDKVIISARSLGEANVQMILEPLGGGGNAATAGAQITGKTVHGALKELQASIEAYYQL